MPLLLFPQEMAWLGLCSILETIRVQIETQSFEKLSTCNPTSLESTEQSFTPELELYSIKHKIVILHPQKKPKLEMKS